MPSAIGGGRDDFLFDGAARGPVVAEGALSGRGLALVRAMCRLLTFHEDGDVVEVFYDWH